MIRLRFHLLVLTLLLLAPTRADAQQPPPRSADQQADEAPDESTDESDTTPGPSADEAEDAPDESPEAEDNPGPPADEAEDEPESDEESAEASAEPPDPTRRTDRPVFAILPSISYNPDDGFGLGAYGDIERRSDSGTEHEMAGGRTVIEDRPHRWRLGFYARVRIKPRQVGWEFLAALSSFPALDGRTEISASVASNGRPFNWWFGLGPDTVRDRTRNSEDDPVKDYWHRFGLSQLRLDIHVFRKVAGPFEIVSSLGIKGTWIQVRPGTLLSFDSATQSLRGLEGGPDLRLGVGFRIDTRDVRIDPCTGGVVSLYDELHLGMEGPWNRLIFNLRGYFGRTNGPVVVATELLFQAAMGQVPFYEQGVFGGFDPDERQLTGVLGLRGLDRGRLRGPLGLLLHFETRFRPPGFRLFKGRVTARLAPVIWVDAVRAATWEEPLAGPALHPAFGGGVRLVLNEVSVTRLDLGTGPESIIDEDGNPDTRWTFGVYATVGQAF